MQRLAICLLGVACVLSQAGIAAAPAPQTARSDVLTALANSVAENSARSASRERALAEQGHTDRIIIVWKGDAAKRAATAAQASIPLASGKASAQASVATHASTIDPDRVQRLERIRTRASEAGQRLKRDLRLTPHRRMTDGTEVMQLPSRMSRTVIADLKQQLLNDPLLANDIADVLPDRIFYPALTPTDPKYMNQWYLTQASGINMPGAWDITTGSSSLVIGIIDTGILPHNDLPAARVVAGYDFVSLTAREGDTATQPGRDNDPTDPGDACTGADTASWHGTTMAGVIAANANNATGIAGINWNSKILPVRAVGKCGGYESDIVDAIRWAVGIAVAGAPANANPAKVLNMSLAANSPAATGGCASNVTPPNITPLQNAIADVLALGVPVVAAAGNDGDRKSVV